MIVLPLVWAPVFAVVGGAAGYMTFGRFPRSDLRARRLLLALVALAIAMATVPNVGQQLYDVGVSASWSGVLTSASYVLFAFCVTGAWLLLRESRKRWLLLVLIPVSFAQPLLWTLVLVGWTVNGFAP